VKSELYRERLPATPAAVRRARLGVATHASPERGLPTEACLADIALAVSGSDRQCGFAMPIRPRNDGHVEVSVRVAPPRPSSSRSRTRSRGIKNAVSDTRGLGIGLALMHAQTDSMEVESNSTGTVVTLTDFAAPGPDQPPPS
jgi:hypothetical protein